MGAGVAGLRAAVELADHGDVLVVTKESLGESNTHYAQGGIAVAMEGDEDVALHFKDTLAAGDGLVFRPAAQVLVAEGPERVAEFLLLNSEFPHSVRFAADHLQRSLEAINQAAASKRSPRVAKIAGRLSAGLMFTPLEEVVARLAEFFADIQQQCARIHTAIYEVYITYPVEAALEA